ncbi:unnamed protein product [Amoebophrya sp. A25]|nr:unnamed protein product [Amoebophrya sp. A25]|eukprot:GSA25T00021827001.1
MTSGGDEGAKPDTRGNKGGKGNRVYRKKEDAATGDEKATSATDQAGSTSKEMKDNGARTTRKGNKKGGFSSSKNNGASGDPEADGSAAKTGKADAKPRKGAGGKAPKNNTSVAGADGEEGGGADKNAPSSKDAKEGTTTTGELQDKKPKKGKKGGKGRGKEKGASKTTAEDDGGAAADQKEGTTATSTAGGGKNDSAKTSTTKKGEGKKTKGSTSSAANNKDRQDDSSTSASKKDQNDDWSNWDKNSKWDKSWDYNKKDSYNSYKNDKTKSSDKDNKTSKQSSWQDKNNTTSSASNAKNAKSAAAANSKTKAASPGAGEQRISGTSATSDDLEEKIKVQKRVMEYLQGDGPAREVKLEPKGVDMVTNLLPTLEPYGYTKADISRLVHELNYDDVAVEQHVASVLDNKPEEDNGWNKVISKAEKKRIAEEKAAEEERQRILAEKKRRREEREEEARQLKAEKDSKRAERRAQREKEQKEWEEWEAEEKRKRKEEKAKWKAEEKDWIWDYDKNEWRKLTDAEKPKKLKDILAAQSGSAVGSNRTKSAEVHLNDAHSVTAGGAGGPMGGGHSPKTPAGGDSTKGGRPDYTKVYDAFSGAKQTASSPEHRHYGGGKGSDVNLRHPRDAGSWFDRTEREEPDYGATPGLDHDGSTPTPGGKKGAGKGGVYSSFAPNEMKGGRGGKDHKDSHDDKGRGKGINGTPRNFEQSPRVDSRKVSDAGNYHGGAGKKGYQALDDSPDAGHDTQVYMNNGQRKDYTQLEMQRLQQREQQMNSKGGGKYQQQSSYNNNSYQGGNGGGSYNNGGASSRDDRGGQGGQHHPPHNKSINQMMMQNVYNPNVAAGSSMGGGHPGGGQGSNVMNNSNVASKQSTSSSPNATPLLPLERRDSNAGFQERDSAANRFEEEGRKKPQETTGKHVVCKKHSSMGCALITFIRVEHRNGVLRELARQAAESGQDQNSSKRDLYYVNIAGTTVSVRARTDKSKGGADVPTDIFVGWGRKVEQTNPIASEDLIEYFDAVVDKISPPSPVASTPVVPQQQQQQAPQPQQPAATSFGLSAMHHQQQAPQQQGAQQHAAANNMSAQQQQQHHAVSTPAAAQQQMQQPQAPSPAVLNNAAQQHQQHGAASVVAQPQHHQQQHPAQQGTMHQQQQGPSTGTFGTNASTQQTQQGIPQSINPNLHHAQVPPHMQQGMGAGTMAHQQHPGAASMAHQQHPSAAAHSDDGRTSTDGPAVQHGWRSRSSKPVQPRSCKCRQHAAWSGSRNSQLLQPDDATTAVQPWKYGPAGRRLPPRSTDATPANGPTDAEA